jgi:penicillin amidase
VNPEIVTDLAKAMEVNLLEDEEIKLLDRLSRWKGNYPLKSIEPTLFHRWIYFFLKNTFEDELGEELFRQMLYTHFHKRLIAPMATKESSVWWDNVKTTDKVESKNEIVQLAFGQAVQSLRDQLGGEHELWTWDRVHTLEHEHPIGQVAGLRSFFNVGPFAVRGSREVINNMDFHYQENGKNNVHSGPSTRRIIDFSDIEQSLAIIPTGQSGNPLSSHYEDQADLFIHGKFRKMLLNREEIIRTSNSLLIFKK